MTLIVDVATLACWTGDKDIHFNGIHFIVLRRILVIHFVIIFKICKQKSKKINEIETACNVCYVINVITTLTAATKRLRHLTMCPLVKPIFWLNSAT